MLHVTVVENKEEWESFLLRQPWTPFFQSWHWAEVQKRLGHEIFRFGLFEGKRLYGICLAVLIEAKRGRYLHIRHGPLLSNFRLQFDHLLSAIKNEVSALQVDFIRMSPLVENDSFDLDFLRKRGFRNAPIHNMDAENAWVLDLDKSEEELLSQMRKTTRYLVRKAQNLPIKISATAQKGDFNEFMKLYEETSKRHKFVPHKGIEEEFEIFSKEGLAKLFLARYKRRAIAGALVIFYGNQAVYHHGASSDEYKDIPATYLLQWEAIKEAKRLNKSIYNFWGVVPPEKSRHPWQGLTLFKTGFGGRRVNFIHAQDLPLTFGYWKTFSIETAWRIYRGY